MVSIIIVNYNGKIHLQKCIDSILNNNYKNYEIIVVDNNSNDESVDFIKKFSYIRLIQLDKNYGYAKPNNMGAKIANGDYLFFLNNDTTIYRNTIEELLKAFQTPKIGMCQSLLLHPDQSIDSSGDYVDFSGIPFSSKKPPLEIKKILSARGAGMMVKKNIFWELLGFDEKFFASFEDVDIGWRSWLWGYDVLLAPKSIVLHEGGVTIKKLPNEIKFHGVKNFLIINLVYFERPMIFTFICLLNSFLKAKFQNSKTNANKKWIIPPFYISLKGFFWILRNIGYIKNKKKLINSKRKLSTSDLIKMDLIKEN